MNNKEFISKSLGAMNKYRAKHGVSALKLNQDLVALAQNWAEHLANNNVFKHADNKYQGKPLGENIAMKYSSSGEEFTGQAVADQWYSEIVRFDFNKASGPSTGHFSQIVWKGSKDYGVGRAQSKEGKWLVVANFFPAGNMLGTYKENVMPPVNGKIEAPKMDKEPGGGLMETKRTTSVPTSSGPMSVGHTSTNRSTKTETRTGADGKTIKKIIITETTIDPSGKKSVKTTETTEEV